MADDKHDLPPEDDNSDISPSAMFLEMMRQAAQRSEPPPSEEPDPVLKELQFVFPDEFSEDDVEEEPDTQYVREAELFPDGESAPNDILIEHELFGVPDDMDEAEDSAGEPAGETDDADPIGPGDGRVPVYAAPETDEEKHAAQMEAQRIRRIKRRQQQRQRRRVGIIGGFLRTGFITVIAAILASTIFTWFTNPEFFTPGVVTGLQVAESTSVFASAPLTPTVIPVTPNWARRIGIVSGHRGPEDDPGAVCPDGLTEREINFEVAQLVVRELRERGYSVDLLDEFDPRLDNYQAAALVSIHANDCQDYGEYVSGYLVARAAARPAGGLDDVLAECIARDYGAMAQIQRRFSLTIDMTDYHTFREIHPLTPAAIIELGFMKDDRDLLVNQQGKLAQGISTGILCFLSGENPMAATETPAPDTIDVPAPTEVGG